MNIFQSFEVSDAKTPSNFHEHLFMACEKGFWTLHQQCFCSSPFDFNYWIFGVL